MTRPCPLCRREVDISGAPTVTITSATMPGDDKPLTRKRVQGWFDPISEMSRAALACGCTRPRGVAELVYEPKPWPPGWSIAQNVRLTGAEKDALKQRTEALMAEMLAEIKPKL